MGRELPTCSTPLYVSMLKRTQVLVLTHIFHYEVLNPKGIPSQSPGLEQSDYPGWTFIAVTTPTGPQRGCVSHGTHEDATLSGLEMSPTLTQGSSFLATLGFVAE